MQKSSDSLPIFSRSARLFRNLLIAVVLTAGTSSCDTPAQGATGSEQFGPVIGEDAEDGLLRGRVVSIADGDSITILTDDREEAKIRLADVDAPERGQPWGSRSKQVLSGMVFGREVHVRQTDVDRWGRVVGHVSVGGLDVNREMVALGAAWAYKRYLSDPSLIEVEARAKHNRLGLWAMSEAETVPPWDWRQGARIASPSSLQSMSPQALQRDGSSIPGAFICGTKTRCSQMLSCAEAEFYLQQCRLSTIDGNRDGKPCEQLCSTISRQ